MAISLVGVLLIAAIVVQKAWVTDDAYITFRSAQHLAEGRGAVWNVGERVQVYTHPLWMLLVSASYPLTGEFFYTSLAWSVLLTLAAVGLVVFRLASSWQAGCLGVALLAVSRAFTDFSTSGLENPLSHLLLVLLMLQGRRLGPNSTFRFTLLVSLALLTRLDLLLLVLPAWATHFWRARGDRKILQLAAGLAPLAVWEAFSLLYYGALLPNTAYAKLYTGIPAGEVVARGFRYLQNSLYWDPPTLLACMAALFVSALPNRTWGTTRGSAAELPDTSVPPWAWATGIVLTLGYVVWVGGDFMSGRFLTPPLLVAVGLLVSCRVSTRLSLVAAGVALALLLAPWTSPFREWDYGSEWHSAIDAYGVADERAFYRETGSLLASWGNEEQWPAPLAFEEARWLHDNWPQDYYTRVLGETGVLRPADQWPPPGLLAPSGAPYRKVFLRGGVGFLAYYLGPDVYVLDYHALGDPLLSRLPATLPDPVLAWWIPRLAATGWRTGHYYRQPPVGYIRSIALGGNVIQDPELFEYYEVIRSITRDPLFDRERLERLWRFQLGEYDHLRPRAQEESFR